MSQALERAMTMAEFLDWEEQQEGKYEFNGHTIEAMTGGTFAHAQICINLTTALRVRLRGTACKAIGAELKIEVAGSIRYPDAFVTRTDAPATATVLREPVVVFEVLSPSTATLAFTDKHDEYRDTPSILRYVILAQDRPHATVYWRDAASWTREVVAGWRTLELPEIGIAIPMAEIYEDLGFVGWVKPIMARPGT